MAMVIRPPDSSGWIKWVVSRLFPRSILSDIDSPKELIKALSDEASRETTSYRRAAAFWRVAHITLGLPAAIRGAVAGAVVLASPKWQVAAGVMAIIAAALAGGLTFLGGEARERRAQTLHDAWSTLEAECLLAQVSVRSTDPDACQTALEKLIAMRRDIGTSTRH